jgi:hypothetical protein
MEIQPTSNAATPMPLKKGQDGLRTRNVFMVRSIMRLLVTVDCRFIGPIPHKIDNYQIDNYQISSDLFPAFGSDKMAAP